jgi:hypothetical protein
MYFDSRSLENNTSCSEDMHEMNVHNINGYNRDHKHVCIVLKYICECILAFVLVHTADQFRKYSKGKTNQNFAFAMEL